MEATAVLTVLTLTNVGSVITAGVSLVVMWKSGFFKEEKKEQLVVAKGETNPEMVKKVDDYYEEYDNPDEDTKHKSIPNTNSYINNDNKQDYYEENYTQKETEDAYYYTK